MKKLIFNFLVAVGISISFCATCSKPEIEVAQANKTKLFKHNYIVINSVDNTPAQVEVSYSVYVAGNSENIVKTQKLTTPFIFGGEDVQVVYDSLIKIHKSDRSFYYNEFKRNYNPKGADYLEIKNLSNTDLEYCIIGNEPLTYSSINRFEEGEVSNMNLIDKTKIIEYSPTPIYKGVPILYLIKPELAPQRDVYIFRTNGYYKNEGYTVENKYAQKITLKTPIFGDMVLNNPFSPIDILNLYRRELNLGATLYKDYSYYDDSFYKGINGSNSLKSDREKIEEGFYYNTISAKQTFSNTGKVWFINHYYFSGNLWY